MLLGEKGASGLLRGVAEDLALRQTLMQFINLSLGEIRVMKE